MAKEIKDTQKKWYYALYGNTENQIFKATDLNEANLLALKEAAEKKTIVIRVKEAEKTK